MNRYKLTKAGVNPNEGINRFNGNKELYEKFLMEFPEDPHFADLKKAIEAEDVKEAFAQAHALKGVCGNLSLEDLYQAIVPLVEELRAESLLQAEELFEPVAANYKRVIEALKE